MRVRDWAPSGLAGSRRLQDGLNEIVTAWRERWLGRGQLSVTAVAEIGPGGRGSAEMILGPSASGLRLTVSSRARGRLLDQCLDVRLAEQSLTDGDRGVLEQLQAAMFQDLFDRVDERLAGREAGDAALLEVRVGDGYGDVLLLALPCTATKGLWTSPSQDGALKRPIASLAEALRETEVVVEAFLGEATLSLADLRALAPGDVLVLGTPLSHPSPVRLSRAGTTLGHAALSEAEGALVATLVA